MIHESISTTELAFAQKFLDALKAYGLTPAEAGATVALISTIGDGRNEKNSDGLRIQIASHKVIDEGRAKFVRETVNQFIDDFINAAGIDPEKLKQPNGHYKTPISERNEDADGVEFSCYNLAKCSKWEGPNRTLNDVWNGLDQMIQAKGKWTSRAA